MADTDFLTGLTSAQMIQRDQRDQDTSLFSDGWTPEHTVVAWGLFVVFLLGLMLYVMGDGNWPWQRKDRGGMV